MRCEGDGTDGGNSRRRLRCEAVDALKSRMALPKGIEMMRELFFARDDVFAVQVRRGSSWGYQPIHRALTDADIKAHLEGHLTLGTYSAPLFTPWLCIDIDSREIEVLRPVCSELEAHQVSFYMEDSGNKGYHGWILFDKPLSNWKARAIGQALAPGHEIFPKQDRVPEGRLGNLIKLPLGIHRSTGRRCLFVDDNLVPCPDQFLFLSKIERVDGETLWKAFAGVRKPGRGARARDYVAPEVVKPCIKRLLANGIARGTRNRIGHAIASEFRRVGMVKDEARGALKTWNLRNRPPLPIVELLTVLDSAYMQEYEYGCGEGSLLRSVPECVGPAECDYYRKYCVGGVKQDARVERHGVGTARGREGGQETPAAGSDMQGSR